jgi:hypothetical protein
MTRADVELIYAWLIATYGDPSERSTAVTFVERNDYYQRDGDPGRDRKRRMHRQKHRDQD